MSAPKIRWGILSTAEIARKNWKAISNSGNGVVAAVASRNLDRSRKFIAECQSEVPFDAAPKALGTYEELIASPDIDAVYIPLPTGLRKEWVLRAAAAGKHVVCEKPCAPNLADLDAMIAACRAHNVQFMDGVMFMHSRRLDAMRQVLDDGTSVGNFRRIQSAFSFRAPDSFFSGNIRAHSGLEPQGCLGDLGWYCLRFTLWATRWRLPRRVTGRLLSQIGRADSPAAVPTGFSAELDFDDQLSAGFYCAFTTEHQQWAVVSGEKGYLRVPDFVLPYYGSESSFEVHNAAFEVSGCEFQMKPGMRRVTVAEHSNSHPTAQESNLFRNFSAAVLAGQLNSEWPDSARKTQCVMEACLQSARDGGRPVDLA